jgi:hypothetical protein
VTSVENEVRSQTRATQHRKDDDAPSQPRHPTDLADPRPFCERGSADVACRGPFDSARQDLCPYRRPPRLSHAVRVDLDAHVRISRIAIPYIQRPWAAGIVASGLYAVVFVMRLMIHGTDPITVFYIFPVALLAMTFGSRAGLVAGLLGVLLIAAWGAIDNVAADPLGWLGRIAPIMLLGFLVGGASDQLRAAAQTQQALFAAQLREREAAEINDSIIQGLAAAKWSVEAGQIERGLDALTDTIATTESLVTALLHNQPLSQTSDST